MGVNPTGDGLFASTALTYQKDGDVGVADAFGLSVQFRHGQRGTKQHMIRGHRITHTKVTLFGLSLHRCTGQQQHIAHQRDGWVGEQEKFIFYEEIAFFQ